MEQLHEIIPDHILHALGWTVLHSLWQGLAIALLLAVFLFASQKKSAQHRYLASFVALGSTLLAAIITFFILLENGGGELIGEVHAADGTLLGTYFLEPDSPVFFEKLNGHMPLIVVGWLVGLAFFLLKNLGGLLYVERLKHRHLFAVPAAWQGILEHLQRQLGFHTTIRLTASALVKVPMVVGWLKPVVLMPIGALNQLSTEQVEAILAHELAHIARYDYLLNLVQSFVEVLFYFNPAVWWVSARIRTEREHCCDDLAVALCGDPLTYAKALVSLREMHQITPTFALSFAAGKNQLLARIQRILQQPSSKSNAMEKISVVGLVLAAVIALSFRAQSNVNFAPDEEEFAEITDLNFWENEKAPLHFELDTLPKGDVRYQWSDNEGTGELQLKDGEITYLEIDGEEIPASEYPAHEALVAELLESVQTPPTPPAPPSPPSKLRNGFPSPPAPPSPPTAPRFPEAMPAPPAPPANKVTTERNGKTTTITIEGTPGSEPLEIEVESGRRGTVTINGEELKNLQDGSQTITLEGPNRLFYDQARARAFWESAGAAGSSDIWEEIATGPLLQFQDNEFLFDPNEHPALLQDHEELQKHLFELDTERKQLNAEQREKLFQLREEARLHREDARLQRDEALALMRQQQAEMRELQHLQRQEAQQQLRQTMEQAREMERELLRKQREQARKKKAM